MQAMKAEHSKIINEALFILELKVAEYFFYEEYGKYLRNEQSWDEFRMKIDSFK